MKLGVFLPSQAKLGLNSKPGLSGVAKGGVGDGKRASFLQILRPKTGLKVKAATASGKPVSSGQGASKQKSPAGRLTMHRQQNHQKGRVIQRLNFLVKS